MLGESARDDLRLIAGSAFGGGGALLPFWLQMERFAFGDMAPGDFLVVAGSASGVCLPGLGDAPVVMGQRTARGIEVTGEISLSELRRLPVWLAAHPLAMESAIDEDAVVVVADGVHAAGDCTLATVSIERCDGLAEVTGVETTTAENLAYFVGNTLAAGKEVRANARTAGWARRRGIPFPDDVAAALLQAADDAADDGDGRRSESDGMPEWRGDGLRGYSVAEIALILGADEDDVTRAVDEALRGSQMPMGPDGEARVYPWDLHRVWNALHRGVSC